MSRTALVPAVWLGLTLLATAADTTTARAEKDDLLGALGCPACHADLDVPTDIRSKAPSLDDAGHRWRLAYLFDYLKEPRSVRRHIGPARMPDFHLSEEEALALTAFLAEQKRLPDELPPLPATLDDPVPQAELLEAQEQGLDALGRDQSCLACHSSGTSGGTLGPDLANVGARLSPQWIRRFLAAPAAWGVADGVMPALFLRPDEHGALQPVEGDEDAIAGLRRLSEFLAHTGATQRAAQRRAYREARARHPSVTARDGERIFDALACRGCHELHGDAFVEPAPDLRREKDRVRAAWLRDYLTAPHAISPFGSRPGNGARMPDFRLSEEEANRLTERLHAGAPEFSEAPTVASLSARQKRRARRLLEEKLACLGCHELDGAGGRVGPNLTNVATRLRPAFVRNMVANPSAAVPHTTMPQPILDEETRRLVVDYLLEPREAVPTDYLSLIEYETIPLPDAHGPAHDYALYCAPCHGAAGGGDGFNASFLPTAPTVHADASALEQRADDTLFDGIHGGGVILDRSRLMPAWGETLSAERIAELVYYLRKLCECTGPAWSRSRPSPASAAPRALPVRIAKPSTPQPAPPAPPTFDDFLGAETCAECHAEIYEVWRASTHGRAGGRPGETEVIAAFDGVPRLFRDGAVRPIRTADGRYVFEVRQNGRPKRILEVAAVIGGGHLLGGGTQTFFTEMPDGSLRMLPFDFHRGRDTWFVQRRQDDRWTPIGPHVGLDELDHWPPYRALGSAPRLSNCENCHGSQLSVDFDPSTSTYETRWKSLRIDCESCHGPGRSHIAWAHATDRDQREDTGMESLELVNKETSVRVCLRCHANKQVVAPGYLPGADLEAHLALKLPLLAQDPYLPDGRIDGFGYQQNHLFSDCFVEGSMVCTDCHDPHSQTYRDIHGRELEGRFDDRQCTGCHASKALRSSDHTHHAPNSPGSRCTACHMPYLQHQTIGNEIPFARSDHTIPIPRPAFDESIGIQNACAPCHADRSTAQLQAQVDSWWGPIKPHHPMIRRLLESQNVAESSRAAELLLVPDTGHTIAQLAALSSFVRNHVRNDAGLPEVARERLLALAAHDDVDVAAIALTALQIALPDDPKVKSITGAARRNTTARAEAIRRRWQYALLDLQRLRARKGARDQVQGLAARRQTVLRALSATRASKSTPPGGSPTTATPQSPGPTGGPPLDPTAPAK